MKTTTIFLLAIAATAGLQAQTTVSTVPVFLEDFEVYSSYTFVTPGTATAVNTNLYTEGAYTILANPSYSHNLYASFTDHSGIGKMLVANGKQTAVGAPDNVWSRRIIGLTKGASYKAKLYATSVYASNPAQLQFRINSTELNPILTLVSGSTGVWETLEATFTAPASEFTLTIRDVNTGVGGNDFAIDDITVSEAANPANVYFAENFDYESGYGYVTPGSSTAYPNGNLWTEGNYTIDSNAHNSHALFNPFADHTSGSGNMMIFNGATDAAHQYIWSRQVTGLDTTKQYALQAYAASAYSPAPQAVLEFRVKQNGVWTTLPGAVSVLATAPGSQDGWTTLTATFTPTSSTVIFGIFDTSTATGGNDFVLDDIQLCKGSCANMSVNSITPNSGMGLSQKFTYVFKGATSIASGRLLLNTGPFENNAGCDVEFVQAGKVFNMVYAPAQTGVAQASGTLVTTQCSLKLATSTIQATGNTLTVAIDVTFPNPATTTGGPNGQQFHYVQLKNTAGQTMLDWYNPASPDPTPDNLLGANWNVSVTGPPLLQNQTPFEWDGSLQTVPVRQGLFTFKATSPNGGGFLSAFEFDYMPNSPTATGNCRFYYFPLLDAIYMLDQNGAYQGVYSARTTVANLPNSSPTSAATCTVHTGPAATSVVSDSTGMTVSLTIEFASGFYGRHEFRGNAFDVANQWDPVGTAAIHGYVTAFGPPPPPPPDYSMTVTPSGSTVAMAGSTAAVNYTVNVAPVNAFSGAVTLAATGLPGGATATFNPAVITGSGTSTMTVNVSKVKVAANFTFSVIGQSGLLNHSAANQIAVQDFAFTASPTYKAVAWQSGGIAAEFSFSVTGLNGFTGTANVIISQDAGCPTLAVTVIQPPSITLSGPAATGNATGTVNFLNPPQGAQATCFYATAFAGGISRRVYTQVDIKTTGDFYISVSGPQTISAPGTATYNVTTPGINGFNGTVALSASGLPAGVTATFGATSAGGVTPLTLTAASGTVPNTYTIGITGTSTIANVSITKTNGASLTIQGSPGFSISTSPYTRTATQSSITGYTVLLTTTQAFSGQVALSTAGLPSGATPSFSPASLSGAGASGLNIVTAASLPLGTYPFTINATNGSTVRSTNAFLVVSGSAPARIISPFPGSTLVVDNTLTTANFTWDTGIGASMYKLAIGTSATGTDAVTVFTGTSVSSTITLPAASQDIYVTLSSLDAASGNYIPSAPALYRVRPRPTGIASTSLKKSFVLNNRPTIPNYFLLNNNTLTDLGPFFIQECLSGIPPGEGCSSVDYAFISTCWLSVKKTNGVWEDIQSNEIWPIGPDFGLTFAIPSDTLAGVLPFLSCTVKAVTVIYEGVINIYDGTPVIKDVQQDPPELPNGSFYITITGDNFGKSPGTVDICKTGLNPCTTNSEDFSKIDYAAQESSWNRQFIKVLVTPTSNAVGDFDVVVTSSGSSGNGFFPAAPPVPGQISRPKSDPKPAAVKRLPIKVFIIHGISDSSASFQTLANNLAFRLGTNFIVDNTFNFPECVSIVEGADKLAQHVLDNTPALRAGQRIAFIAHSMGGLIVRSLLERRLAKLNYLGNNAGKYPQVVGIATLGTPNLGAPTYSQIDGIAKCGIQLDQMKSELRTSLVLNQVMSFFLNDLRLAWNDTVFPKPRWFAVAGSACDAATRIVNPSQGCRDGDPGKFSDGAVCRESADLSHPSLPSLGDLNPDLRWSDPNTIFRHATDMQGPLSFGPLMCGNNVGTQALTNPSPVGTMFNKLVDFIYDLNK